MVQVQPEARGSQHLAFTTINPLMPNAILFNSCVILILIVTALSARLITHRLPQDTRAKMSLGSNFIHQPSRNAQNMCMAGL